MPALRRERDRGLGTASRPRDAAQERHLLNAIETGRKVCIDRDQDGCYDADTPMDLHRREGHTEQGCLVYIQHD